MVHRITMLVTLALAGGVLSGCAGAVVGGAAATGYTAMQERTVGEAVDDTVIETRISHELLQEDVDNLFRKVEVDVIQGRVHLTGAVPKPEHRAKAVQLAWKAPGVKEVINEIQVNDKSGLGDYTKDVWISSQVRTRLLLEKGVRSANYNVETVNGVVYLMGIAQDRRELAKVTTIARRVKGVRQVVSHVRMKASG